MRKLRILAVDDEALALTRIEALLRRVAGVELAAVARTAQEALARIAEGGIDVVLLDIRLTGSDGFDVAAALREAGSPQVIFVTSYDEYAVRAFDMAATDYLMKPVEPQRLRQALDRARTAARARAALTEPPREGRDEAPLWFALRGGAVRVQPAEIRWIEAEGDYIRIHTDGGSHFLRRTLSRIEAELSPEQFLRVGRSAMVCIARIRDVRRGRSGVWITLDDGTPVKVGRNHQAQVWRLLT